MGLGHLLGLSAAAVAAYMTLVWAISLIKRDASIVDVFWGPGFIVVAALHFALGDGFEPRGVLVLALVTVWGLRLGGHILWRNWGRGEDRRYQEFRANAGPSFWWRSYFTVFLLQGGLLWVISMSLLAAQLSPEPAALAPTDVIDVVLWLTGMVFEAGGDLQLARFRADPQNRGRVLRTGLWGLTRHPNYFGDAVVWWAYFVFAAGTLVGAWTVFSPLLMTALLLRVSGVRLLERSLVETKPEYREYMQSTPAFLPRIPGWRK